MLGDRAAGEPIVAGPLVRLACERHLRDRQDAEAGGFPWIFDTEAADHVFAFFEAVLRLPDTLDETGAPKPFLLQPWQAFIVGALFGWKAGATGLRRFREAYVEVSKGAGKTPLAAGLGLYGLVADGPDTAREVYAAATDRLQAGILHRDAMRMVEASPDLDALLYRSVGNIAFDAELSFFRPFSREQGVKSGPRPHFALVDELHEHPSGEVLNKLKAGFKHRKQPLLVMITNSGFDRTSICWQQHAHAEQVLRGGLQDDHHFGYVCALDEGDDPLTDRTCWPKVNPSIGVTISEDYLARQVENARNLPAELNTVLRLNFCIWTQQHSRFLDMPKWYACRRFEDDELAGARCYAGLDLGQSDDLSAHVRIWMLDDGRVAVKGRFWIPRAARLAHPDRPYEEWIRAGVLEETDGDVVDYDVIERVVSADCRDSGVIECAYDKRFAGQMALHLEDDGVTMIDTPQGFFLNEAVRRLAELVKTGQLAHNGNPVLAWMASNVVVKHGRNQEVRLDKQAAGDKIDGVSALVMALSRALAQPVAAERSVYEDRGIHTFGGRW